MQRGEAEQQLLRVGRSAWAVVGVALVAAFTWWLVDQASVVLVPLAFALFPAAILTPPARWLERRGLGRTGSSTLVMALAAAAVAGTVALLVLQVQAQSTDLVEQAKQGYEQVRERLGDGVFGLPPIDVDDAVEQVREGVATGAATPNTETGSDTANGTSSSPVVRVFTASATFLAQLAFALVATFLFVRDGDRMAAWFRNLFPARWRGRVKDIGKDVGDTLGGYVRGQATVAAIDAVFIGLGLVILGVPLALSLTVLTFVAAFVPIAGAFASGAAAALVAMAAGGFGDALIVVGLVVLVQQVEGNVLQPWILGNRVSMHPLGVLTALTLGGMIYGLVGAVLAVPFAAVGYRVADRLVALAREDQPQDADDPEPGDTSARPTVCMERQA